MTKSNISKEKIWDNNSRSKGILLEFITEINVRVNSLQNNVYKLKK